MSSSIIRIAMWSGPRNISTAMMRAWENRADTAVVDEPFYACYLNATGVIHPLRQTVLASQSQVWQDVIDGELSQSLQPGESIHYQKHMSQHMVANVDKQWFGSLRHAFLIRHPAEVVHSYSKKRSDISADDVGFKRQRQLFDQVRQQGLEAPVIESADVLKNPQVTLSKLCSVLGVAFDPAMLEWPSGRRESDGVWAPHWYQTVERSTTFAPYQPRPMALTDAQKTIVDQCLPDYFALAAHKL